MAEEKENQNRYFQHDEGASSDEKIIAMNYFFRRINENNLEKFLKEFLLPLAAYGLFWKIIEHLHKHTIQIDKLCFLADEWRVDEEFFKLVLEKFNLFEIKDGCYISKRVLRNLEEQQKRKKRYQDMANNRWQNNQKPKEKTEEEKEALKKAIDFLNESENIPLNQQFTSMYCQFQKLDEVQRMKALEFYKEVNKTESKKVSTNKMLEFIKGGLQDAQEE
ncbi:hypothetical protein IJ425_04110 [bacterium]|nr:hypothetical protein [bacterium]